MSFRKSIRLFLSLAFLSISLTTYGGLRKHTTILPLGDSITQGSGGCTSYTLPLRKMLLDAGYDVEFVGPRANVYDFGEIRHGGFSGRTVEFLEERIDTLYKKYPADIVLIHSGHNHFVEEDPVPGMIAAHRSMIDKILDQNPDAWVFVAQVIPSGKLPKYSYIPDFNREVKKLVRSYHSRHVRLVNVAHGFDWQIYTLDDKVHPNEKGAALMAKTWFKAIKPFIKR